MEIYLSHMFIFRIIEKIGINKLLGNGWIQYIMTVIIVVLGATIFALIMQKVLSYISRNLMNK